MAMTAAPKNQRLHIGLFGRRNVGKSSVLNALTHQTVSIVSDIAGTTTDPVEKPMELLPFGPVLFIDTAGIDDTGELGELRIARTRSVFDRTDLGVIVTHGSTWDQFEESLYQELQMRQVPGIAVFNKSDVEPPDEALVEQLRQKGLAVISASAATGEGIAELRQALLKAAPDEYLVRPTIVADLVGPEQCAVLVVPIDKEAPKGRIILPQVQAIRDLLDHGRFCMVTRESELPLALKRLAVPPALVVTDSQAFQKVASDTPEEIPMTSFSILFARRQGDLSELVRGAMAIEELKAGQRVLVAEACTHHPIEEDIGTVKIPAWLKRYVGGELVFDHVRGHDFPEDLSPYSLVIHCGACMWNRREMLNRILRCKEAGVPVTNYGLTIAYSLGVFERALKPFPAALEVYERARANV